MLSSTLKVGLARIFVPPSLLGVVTVRRWSFGNQREDSHQGDALGSTRYKLRVAKINKFTLKDRNSSSISL